MPPTQISPHRQTRASYVPNEGNLQKDSAQSFSRQNSKDLSSELNLSKARNPNKRGRKFFANQLHREIFFIVLGGALIPTLMTTVCLFYLIFNITAEEIGIPESIAYNLIPAAQKVTTILLVATPLVVLVFLILAHKISHKIIGPFDRIVRELEERLDTKRRDPIEPIRLRSGDKFRPLVEKINELLGK